MDDYELCKRVYAEYKEAVRPLPFSFQRIFWQSLYDRFICGDQDSDDAIMRELGIPVEAARVLVEQRGIST